MEEGSGSWRRDWWAAGRTWAHTPGKWEPAGLWAEGRPGAGAHLRLWGDRLRGKGGDLTRVLTGALWWPHPGRPTEEWVRALVQVTDDRVGPGEWPWAW